MALNLTKVLQSLRIQAGAYRESNGWGGAPLAVIGLSNLSKSWLFLDFKFIRKLEEEIN